MTDPRNTAEAIVGWCATANDLAAFSDGLFERLAIEIPFDGAFLAAVDPDTLLYTRAFRREMPAEASAAFIRTELGVDDVNQLRHLVRTSSPVGWLDGVTHGDRMASRRYRHAMRPHGLGDELRVALMVDGTCWGLLCLHRAEAGLGFAPRDSARLAKLAPAIACAIRRELVSEQAHIVHVLDGPGVAVLNAEGTVQSSTAAGSAGSASSRTSIDPAWAICPR